MFGGCIVEWMFCTKYGSIWTIHRLTSAKLCSSNYELLYTTHGCFLAVPHLVDPGQAILRLFSTGCQHRFRFILTSNHTEVGLPCFSTINYLCMRLWSFAVESVYWDFRLVWIFWKSNQTEWAWQSGCTVPQKNNRVVQRLEHLKLKL